MFSQTLLRFSKTDIVLQIEVLFFGQLKIVTGSNFYTIFPKIQKQFEFTDIFRNTLRKQKNPKV